MTSGWVLRHKYHLLWLIPVVGWLLLVLQALVRLIA